MKGLLTQKGKPAWLVVLVLPLVLASCGTGNLPVEADPLASRSVDERVLALVNRERSRRGLEKVRLDPGLQQMAARHALALARRVDPSKKRPSHATAHQGFDARARQARTDGYLVLSEVVMVGYGGDLGAVPERTVQGWLGSTEHRNALLQRDRRLMGIASRIVQDGRYFVVGLLSNGQIR